MQGMARRWEGLHAAEGVRVRFSCADKHTFCFQLTRIACAVLLWSVSGGQHPFWEAPPPPHEPHQVVAEPTCLNITHVSAWVFRAPFSL
jgi:hypothetical protein